MFMPDHKDPNREWKDIGGDLERQTRKRAQDVNIDWTLQQ